MQVTFDIPDTLADQPRAAGKDPARAALEALAVEAYRTRQMNESEVRRLLGFGTRMQVHQLLMQHNVHLHYSEEHLRQDIAASDQLHAERELSSARAA